MSCAAVATPTGACRNAPDLYRLVSEATRHDERQVLGCFPELAGRLGGDASLLDAALRLMDKRRKKKRMFLTGPHGSHARAAPPGSC